MDDITFRALTIILNEKKTEYIKKIELKEKKLTIKLSTYYKELLETFRTLAQIETRQNEDSDDDDFLDFVNNNNHLINIVEYEKEYMNGYMDCLKGVIISYDKYLTTDECLNYGNVRQIIVNQISID
jgi:hypothetical protein